MTQQKFTGMKRRCVRTLSCKVVQCVSKNWHWCCTLQYQCTSTNFGNLWQRHYLSMAMLIWRI